MWTGIADQHPRGVPPSDNGSYVIGSTACRTCHRSLYQHWEQSSHAASATLLSFEQSVDGECAACHIPDDGAFDNAVGCEACHGPGSDYAELDVMIDPIKSAAAGLRNGADSCVFCHNPGHPFHVERDLVREARRIHPAPGAAKPY